jgi:ArsR family transcriptional regulator
VSVKLLNRSYEMMKLEPSEMFKVLGVETRVKIIDLLKSRGPLGAKGISELLGVTPAAVSQHLKILRQAGLVRNERKGYWIPYSIDEEALEDCGHILSEVCTCGCKDACRYTGRELRGSDVESLKKYEKELLTELRAVRERIKEIRFRKSK